ncbi:MAG: hypothetical protein JF617_21260 [Burkholderiales bacterium]|nr:hypothetical protein [Burkholderiales bacterium]
MRRVLTIVVAGLVSGTLDILAAFASYVSQGATVEGILKYIASGVLGAAALQGGMAMVALGLLCHFALTTAMAAIFLLAALRLRSLVTHPWLSLPAGSCRWDGASSADCCRTSSTSGFPLPTSPNMACAIRGDRPDRSTGGVAHV